jgi:hypothetical protein
MPGKQPRDGAKPLTRLQSKIAGNVLQPHFEPSLGERQWDDAAKAQLVQAVNEAFAAGGHDAEYTTRKLQDWVSNGIYRWRKKGQNRGVEGGGGGGGAAARQPRKRERVLSSITMKPQEKMVRAADPSGKWPPVRPLERSGQRSDSARAPRRAAGRRAAWLAHRSARSVRHAWSDRQRSPDPGFHGASPRPRRATVRGPDPAPR